MIFVKIANCICLNSPCTLIMSSPQFTSPARSRSNGSSCSGWQAGKSMWWGDINPANPLPQLEHPPRPDDLRRNFSNRLETPATSPYISRLPQNIPAADACERQRWWRILKAEDSQGDDSDLSTVVTYLKGTDSWLPAKLSQPLP